MAASMYELQRGGDCNNDAGPGSNQKEGNKKAGQARFPSFPGHVCCRYIRGRHTVDQVKYLRLPGEPRIVSRRTFRACNAAAFRHMGIDCGVNKASSPRSDRSRVQLNLLNE